MPRIRWTPEEDERLFDLIAAGKSWTLISGMLKRSMKSVKLHAKERLKAERLAREAAGTPVPAKKAKTREKPR
jgi:Myb-like DNA-binding domain